jgi:hypothetical protein
MLLGFSAAAPQHIRHSIRNGPRLRNTAAEQGARAAAGVGGRDHPAAALHTGRGRAHHSGPIAPMRPLCGFSPHRPRGSRKKKTAPGLEGNRARCLSRNFRHGPPGPDRLTIDRLGAARWPNGAGQCRGSWAAAMEAAVGDSADFRAIGARGLLRSSKKSPVLVHTQAQGRCGRGKNSDSASFSINHLLGIAIAALLTLKLLRAWSSLKWNAQCRRQT